MKSTIFQASNPRSVSVNGVCRSLLLFALLGLASARAVAEAVDTRFILTGQHDNALILSGLVALIGTHNFFLPLSFSPDPLIGRPADFVTFTANFSMKTFPAILEVPSDRSVFPNTSDQCRYRVELNQTRADYSDYLGLVRLATIPEDWDVFGSPEVVHVNSDVELFLRNPTYIETDPELVCANDPDPSSECHASLPQSFELPAGRHRFVWEAQTKLSTALDIVLPAALVGVGVFNEFRHGTTALNAATDGAEQVAKRQEKALEKLIDWVENSDVLQGVIDEGILFGVDQTGLGNSIPFFPQVTGAIHERDQSISVFDVHPPTLQVPALVTLEATDIGGVTFDRVRDNLRAAVTATDECGRSPSFGVVQPPALFSLGDNTITWSATDAGPIFNSTAGGPSGNSVSASQIVRVVDTQGPILVPPPGRVLEVSGATSVAANTIDLGAPRVVDLADATPLVSNNSPASFETNSRSEVTWAATDRAGNTTTATQLITVKPVGSNTAPVALDVSTSTLTSQPVDVLLQGTDPDFIDDRFDPLNFRITRRPQAGEFIAPLFPFFIEDLRVPSTDVYGDAFRLANPQTGWIQDNVCNGPLDLRVDWIYQPEFVQVTDDGEYFVLDRYWVCSGGGNASTRQRLSKWSRDGNYMAQVDYEGTDEQFRWEPSNFVDTVRRSRDGSGRNQLTVFRCDPDLAEPCRISWAFGTSNTPGVTEGTLKYVLIDDERGIAYVTDQNRIFAYDIRGEEPDGLFFPTSLGALPGSDGELDVLSRSRGNCTGDGGNSGYTMDIDSRGNLFALEACGDRVHQFEPSGFDDDGNFQPGAHVGWLGRCDASTNNACDTSRGASRGFSCTDSTCSVSQTRGAEPGQFNVPTHLVIDPNDVLYVADRENNRVQRFANDGTFAGVANSTGSGINQGTAPGFVLGNMGQPHAVSVNSSQFFVLDQVERFLHVFETSPLKDITDNSATVTYVSNTDTHSTTDSFEFVASDGLSTSNAALASITVNRNFRPPNAIAQTLTLVEDSNVDFTLRGEDPDGIVGVDFNGLDTLSFRVTRPPRFGQLSSADGSATRTYTPNPEFSGVDSLEFVVNDGVADSEAAELTFEVTAVNDLPRLLNVGLNQKIGRGFPATLNGQFFDDGEDGYLALVSWGDGVQEPIIGLVGEGENARIEGVVVDAPFPPSTTGRVTAQHVYETTGTKDVQFCLWNADTQGGCEDFSVVVEDLVVLDLNVASASESVPHGATVEFSVMLTNLQPETGTGLRANAIAISQPDTEFQALELVGAPTGCGVLDNSVNCLLPALDAGQSVEFVVRGRFNGSELFDTEAAFTLDARSTTPALIDSVRGIQVLSLVADATDTDNDGLPDVWETAFGLVVGSNDASVDPDADGLSNTEEFQFRTNPNAADSDNDGLSDGFEVSQGGDPTVTADSDGDGMANDIDADDDNDGMPDAIELAAGLDPFNSSDALSDADGDGVSNLAETQAGTDPADATSFPPTGAAGSDLFASVLPLSRSVAVGDVASAFATIINDSDQPASACGFAPIGAVDAQFRYQQTDPATNEPVGELNPAATIPPRGFQSFVFTLQPNAMLDQDLALQFICAQRNSAVSLPGINTFRLQASVTPTPDMIAISATVAGGGVVELANGVGAFAVASANVGVSGVLTVQPSSDTDVILNVCQTDTATGQCINSTAPQPTVDVFIEEGASPSFAVFINERSEVPFDPVGNRIVLEFVDEGGVIRGGTGVAVRSR